MMCKILQLCLQEEEELRLWRCSLHGQSELTKLFLLYPFFFFDPFLLFFSPFSAFRNKINKYLFSYLILHFTLFFYICFSFLVPLTIYYFYLFFPSQVKAILKLVNYSLLLTLYYIIRSNAI